MSAPVPHVTAGHELTHELTGDGGRCHGLELPVVVQ
ncbi:hypothetical protein FBZ89_11946 [Nitrospirillum amazonense]|uniref:Uncharacterized protein n=1 Tax=Nitrospirillum amazonense TaxID=28077 RepID=A0A560EWT8_9PROT|nr:hypothetical protein FBZ89_11946 [Nitrospirillum amazonense]